MIRAGSPSFSARRQVDIVDRSRGSSRGSRVHRAPTHAPSTPPRAPRAPSATEQSHGVEIPVSGFDSLPGHSSRTTTCDTRERLASCRAFCVCRGEPGAEGRREARPACRGVVSRTERLSTFWNPFRFGTRTRATRHRERGWRSLGAWLRWTEAVGSACERPHTPPVRNTGVRNEAVHPYRA
jgi:hypothetical protein